MGTNVVRTMPFLLPIFLGMVSLYHPFLNGDDWEMVQKAASFTPMLAQPRHRFLGE